MKKKAIYAVTAAVLVLAIVLSLVVFRGPKNDPVPPVEREKFEFGELVSETEGNTNIAELKFASEEEMVSSMTPACKNGKYELYYSPDNMTVALKDAQTGKYMLSNPYNAALDSNYSGAIGQKLASQIVISYLENETKVVNLYSAEECADKGQYKVKVYGNALSFDMTFGDKGESGVITRAMSEDTYKEICKKISEDSKDILDVYFTYYNASDLTETDILIYYPDAKKQDMYYCGSELSDRDIAKLNAVFDEAGYTRERANKDAKELGLGESAESKPYFDITLNYILTDSGVTVNIPNGSIKYNSDYPLLRVSVLPYFGADEASADSKGYLFIPDGSGTVINMNQDDKGRRTIMTGKVYGENSSKLPLKTPAEKTEQYYLPVFGTVRNNGTALFGIITGGDGNCEITSLLGRPNGNFYTVNPEFIVADYEQYTRISVVSNAWSNKLLYLYDKNVTEDDFNIQYHFLTGDKANYSAMAEVYGNYLFEDGKDNAKRATVNIRTVGSALVKDSFLGFSYNAEAAFTSYEDNIKILGDLKENNAGNVSLTLEGWQKDGLDASVSDKIRISNDLGGKKELKKLAKYCKDEGIPFSLYNDISFVGSDKSFDGFRPKKDAARTLELKYAKESKLCPDTMLYDEGKYVVKASAYNRLISGLLKNAGDYGISNFNMGALGSSLNADYTKNGGINRAQALRYVKQALKNSGKTNLSFEKGNAYVLPYAKEITGISVTNSGLPGETAAVPFIQMVLGGRVSYSSQPVNLHEDIRGALLRCIESGTTPTFLLSYKNTPSLKRTEYTAYYSIDYEILRKTVFESYGYVNKVITATNGTGVVNHEILSRDVAVSTYANGVKVYVNKSDKDYTAGGITVNANDYFIEG
jgi:hypothetical protein